MGDLAPGFLADVVVLGLAEGDGVLWEVGEVDEERAELVVGGAGGGFESLGLRFEGVGLLADGGGVGAFAFELAELGRKGVALGFEGFSLGDGGAALGVQSGEVGEGRGVSAAGAQFFFYLREIGPHES